MTRRDRIPPSPLQESVWDYPRPPRLEPTKSHLVVELAGEVIAETRRGYRVLEESHPPTYYFPIADVRAELLEPSASRTFCEWKGAAAYHHARIGDRFVREIAWSYPSPTRAFAALQGHLCFYASRADACFVDGERVQPQAGDFYGGWITSRIVGPFKGAPGTWGW